MIEKEGEDSWAGGVNGKRLSGEREWEGEVGGRGSRGGGGWGDFLGERMTALGEGVSAGVRRGLRRDASGTTLYGNAQHGTASNP